jgi:adenosylcobinamide kinase/adenosylcobinamide-phosphate guanylyltransferase
MRERIAHHQARRSGWRTVEEPLALVAALAREARPGRVVLVDCLTLWLSNLMHAGRDVDAATRELVACLVAAQGAVVLVSNEVGLGLVPETPLGRSFRDAQGRLNQAIGAVADEVAFIAAGLPLWLKRSSRGAP